MIKSVHFKNFKALIDATLPLNRFTLIVGPNGSGKSTAMQGLQQAGKPRNFNVSEVVTASLKNADNFSVEIHITWDVNDSVVLCKSGWQYIGGAFSHFGPDFAPPQLPENLAGNLRDALRSFQIYSFDARELAAQVQLHPHMTLSPEGSNLAGVLDNLRDKEPERFESLNEELGRWLP